MTFDEACKRFASAPFDAQYMWLDITAEDAYQGVRSILLVDRDGGAYFYQILYVGPDVESTKQLESQFGEWCPCALDARAYVEQDRVWNIGTLQEMLRYARRRAQL